ncbi:MAG: DNA alkylation repair protein [Chlamydiales bacterium]|nr:DNA alkylation repair protein [Chlamydiales bacterium]
MIEDLTKAFKQNSDPVNGAKQAAYMKGHFPFLGLSAPKRRDLQKEVFNQFPIHSEEELAHLVHVLYQKKEREFHYAALDLVQKYRKLVTKFDFIEALTIIHSWWDSVDLLASNVLGFFLKRNPQEIKQMHDWIEDENLWKRRSALLFQLKWKEETDASLLFDFCLKRGSEREFFIEKAIGWALREYGKINQDGVNELFSCHPGHFSSFTQKEALRYAQNSTR